MRQRFNVKSALASPLLIESKPIGVLMAVSDQLTHNYTSREEKFMEGFAREAALAIHTNRLNRQRQDAESRGEEQRSLVNLLMESTEEAIYGVDVKGKCIFVNPSCLRMLGYDDERELIGQDMHELIHHTLPDGTHYPREQCKVRSSTVDGVSSHSSEEAHWRKDGSSFPVEYWSRPIRNDNKVVGAVVSFIDITDRIAAEKSLQESELKYRVLYESASDSIFMMRNENIIDCNQKTLELFACGRAEFVGKTAEDFSADFQPDGKRSQDKALEYIGKAYQGEPQYFEWLCKRKDGSLFSAEVSLARIKVGEEYFLQVVVRDISDRKKAEETIRHMAFHDALTGLVNRHEFENRMAHVLESVSTRNMEHALLYIDLDQFKVVNDTCGHAAGDELLKQLAEILHEPVRERDTVARLGGDEFGVLLENCPANRAEEIANQIVRQVRESRFVWQDKTFSVGASIGIALINEPNQTTGEILKTADMACHMSKELGRNRVHLFTKDDATLLQRETEMGMVSHIHHALDNGRLTLYAQPIVDLNGLEDKQVFKEIFVRMINDDGDVISPAAFIPSAERYNLMPEIDRWVIHEIFSYAAATTAQPGDSKKPIYFINLSGTSLNDDAFLAYVQEQLTREMLDPSQFCFEVTETAAITNITRVRHFIKAIKDLGCRFALDDFGSGLSSFAYLKELPVDFLKIDGSFVRDITRDQKDYSIVESISRLGHSLGIKTVAEFVEDEDILSYVKNIGIDYAQGYGVGRPEPLRKGVGEN
jgi:diguanylate cyclase (GGDEF)-like protein/PAS domain S-box-containing protein